MSEDKNASHWMEAAFELAEEAFAAAEVPVGGVLVGKWTEDQESQTILASGRNEVNKERNATRHAELVLLDRLFEECERRGVTPASLIPSTTLYVTVEPCAMCASALCQVRVPRVVFGCVNPRFGGMGGVINVSETEFPDISIVSKVQESRAVELLRRFYARENEAAPPDVRKPKPNRQSRPEQRPLEQSSSSLSSASKACNSSSPSLSRGKRADLCEQGETSPPEPVS